jgi:hypothetical protein|tara:strand:- start:452 stop:895 length:444 start_codon:yes stop_codon:yes gene_type:complete
MSKEYIQEICDSNEIDVAFINVTATQLKKSIMDATKPVRNLLVSNGLHDYANQEQGTHAKVTLDVYYLEGEVDQNDKASLYRPTSGNGDPRIWFTNLKHYVEAGDVLAIIADPNGSCLYAFNVDTTLALEEYLNERRDRMKAKYIEA